METNDPDDRTIHLLPSDSSVTNRQLIKNVMADFTEEKISEEAFYICNLGEVINKHREWTNFMPRVRPFYAVKCNDNELVLKTLAGLGTGFDCASKREMQKVLEIGVSSSDVIFANPAKQASHVRAAKELGVQMMTFDNEMELLKMKNLHKTAKLVIRIRCDAEKAQCQLGMKFGVDVADAPSLLATAKDLHMDVIGVSFHVGSGCMDPPVFHRAIAASRWLFNVASEIGFEFTLLDIGGGFPGNSGTSIQHIGDVVNASLDKFFPEGCGVEVIAEPGRYYVASAFTLATQIHSLREVKGEHDESAFMYYINDGVYGSFNCVLYDHAVVHPETIKEHDYDEENMSVASIWGPTCDGLDQVCAKVLLPKMKLGEWLMFPDMGAYTLVAAGTFNGFPVPKVHYVVTIPDWSVLKQFMGLDKVVVADLPIYLEAGLGYNRDAVGWNSAAAMLEDALELQQTSDNIQVQQVDPNGQLLLSNKVFFVEYATDIPA